MATEQTAFKGFSNMLSLVKSFTGQSDGPGVIQFFESFEEAAILGAWPASTKAGVVKLKLEGEAREHLDSMVELKTASYETLKKALKTSKRRMSLTQNFNSK